MDASPESSPSLDAYPDVDPFLKEAIQNPRHRLTVLRMELDIQRFMQNTEQHQFEFQHFPTSYLRLAAHRVAQHYGLQSMVVDADGYGGKIVVKKTPESKFPSTCLSQIPANVPENEKAEHVKIVIRPRPQKSSPSDASDSNINTSPVRSVEERKEEYDKARARIFSSSSVGDLDNSASQLAIDGRSSCSSADENESCRSSTDDLEKSISNKDANGRVAIFRDREKDRFDPDYDRSYHRYSKGLLHGQAFSLDPFNVQNFQPAFLYDNELPQMGQVPRNQSPISYMGTNPVMNHFGAANLNQASCDPVYMHWPSPTMMYAHSYEHFRQSVQKPFYQHPLSFDHGYHH
ncbi:uncharacterized protein LOC116261457 [Nymphaea colorata]|nr:uncharacterized protein LOC116261457 [Nymphaea colorata]